MTYEGRTELVDHSATLPHGGRVPIWTWQAVEDRMAEAMRHWWRSPDGEARFSLGGRISSIWRQAFTDRMALIDQLDMEPTPPTALPLSRADVARMVEASEWMKFIPEADRRLVVLALVKKASGHDRVPWLTIWKALGRGKPGPEGLRSRYSRAITCVANALNGGNAPRQQVKPLSPASSK
jgi:hypothetical protein